MKIILMGEPMGLFMANETGSLSEVNTFTASIAGAEYTVQDVVEDPQLSALPAVQDGAVYQMPGGLEEWDSPIPSGILGCLWLTSVLHPEEYPFETFTADAADFYQTFYGFAVDESLITK